MTSSIYNLLTYPEGRRGVFCREYTSLETSCGPRVVCGLGDREEYMTTCVKSLVYDRRETVGLGADLIICEDIMSERRLVGGVWTPPECSRV